MNLKITKEEADKVIEILQSRLSMIHSEKWNVSIEHDYNWTDWFSIRINSKHVVAWDSEWILSPWKLEMHLFTRWREFWEEHILTEYNCTKKS